MDKKLQMRAAESMVITEVVARSGMTLVQYRILMAVWTKPGRLLSDICGDLGLPEERSHSVRVQISEMPRYAVANVKERLWMTGAGTVFVKELLHTMDLLVEECAA